MPWRAIAAIMLLAALSPGCVTPGFYGPPPVAPMAPVAPVYGVGYYGPWGGPVGFNYGVWGPRYRVAPYRAPVRGRPVVHGRKPPLAFHAARVGRPVPTIPRRRRLRARRWPALTAPLSQWTYRFDGRACASEPVVAPLTLDEPAGSRTCVLVARAEANQHRGSRHRVPIHHAWPPLASTADIGVRKPV